MGLSKSYDLSHGFGRLIQVDSGHFFAYFQWGYPDLITQVTSLAS